MHIELYNRQRTHALPAARLLELACAAVDVCRGQPGPMESLFDGLTAVEISLVSDREIARVHRQFMKVPGATDVITFPHGEIVISVATAARQAALNGESFPREVARYIVHGLLHLHGHIDVESTDATIMWRAQERVLDQLWPRVARELKRRGTQRPGIASNR